MIHVAAEKFTVLRGGNYQNTVASLETFPQVKPDVSGQGRFVSFVKLYKVAPRMGPFQKLFPG